MPVTVGCVYGPLNQTARLMEAAPTQGSFDAQRWSDAGTCSTLGDGAQLQGTQSTPLALRRPGFCAPPSREAGGPALGSEARAAARRCMSRQRKGPAART